LAAVVCQVDFALASAASRAQLPALPPDTQPHHGERTIRCGPGSIVGELDFFLQRPRSLGAVVEAAGSAWRCPRQAMEAMAAHSPASLAVLQQIVLRSTTLSAAHALEALERSSHLL
jgi:SulP family sulfate permease